ncbi:IclR family transcriptional regulator [Rhodococcus qingshengii]|uniref:IclR family transcriptional regulator n=1 Tax=Rhodococcus qingshengii TaxID=334542 RepID=UPI0035D53E6D
MPNSDTTGDSKHISRAEARGEGIQTGTRRAVDRKSPPTERVLQILNLLADRPRERLTLTQIAAGLDLNKPTCLGILSALTAADFVTRDDTKSYGLGPALLRLGSAAESGLANFDLVRPFISELYDRIGITCLLSAVQADHTVILDRLGTITTGERHDLVGERFPLAPPVGLVNIAWEHNNVIDTWLSRRPIIPLTAGDAAVRSIVESGRAHGYIVESLDTSSTSSVALASLLSSGMPRRIIDELCRHLPPIDWSEFPTTMPDHSEAILPVANVSAPIFNRHGTQQYTLTIVPERADATVAQCKEWATSLVHAARQASTALGGREWNNRFQI